MKTTNQLCFECRSSTCTDPHHTVIRARDYRIPPKRDKRTWRVMQEHYEETGKLLMWDTSPQAQRQEVSDRREASMRWRHRAADLNNKAKKLEEKNHPNIKTTCRVRKTEFGSAHWMDHFRFINDEELHGSLFAWRQDYYGNWKVWPVSRSLEVNTEPCEEHN